MNIYIHDSYQDEKRLFIPVENNKVKMYVCGITVSDNAHIGHALSSVIFDIIKKYFEYIGYEVIYVRNFTDVDDKIINASKKVNMDPIDYANKYIDKTTKELKSLGCDEPTIEPRATEHIKEIIEFIKGLIDKDFAYENNGDVYFKLEKFRDYGHLSNNTLDKVIHNVRKENSIDKDNEIDFALWKKAKDGEISWESPWGLGRPGWHIECSAMSKKYLGETFDIHGGGRDLKFPHHENEIAQSTCLTNKPLANYWIHNGLVKINGVKMSKSLGNGITLEELLNKYYKDVIRLTFIKSNYKTDLNIVDNLFEESERQIYNYALLINKIEKENVDNVIDYPDIISDFINNMNNDFNTPLVVSDILGYYNELNKLVKANDFKRAKGMLNSVLNICGVLGIFTESSDTIIRKITDKYLNINKITENEINDFIKERNNYKNNKDYENADRIRDYLSNKQININDTKDGTSFIIKI